MYSIATINQWVIMQLDVKNASLLGTFMELCLWSNHLALQILPSLLMYVDYEKHSMGLNRLLVLGLTNLVHFYCPWVLYALLQILFFLFIGLLIMGFLYCCFM